MHLHSHALIACTILEIVVETLDQSMSASVDISDKLLHDPLFKLTLYRDPKLVRTSIRVTHCVRPRRQYINEYDVSSGRSRYAASHLQLGPAVIEAIRCGTGR